MGERTEKSKIERLKRKRRKKRILLGLIVFLIFIIAGTASYAFLTLGNVNTKEITVDKEELGIETELEQKIEEDNKKDIKNIILLGVDEFEGNVGRSDAVVIATVDPVHNKLKLTSIMRDSYVNIPGHGYDKLTHAYAFGGEELSIKTINQTYGLNITDYVKVNFDEMENIIDAVGGLDIEIRSDEIENMNEHIRHLSKNAEVKPAYIKSAGMKHLNGLQSLAYTRIRYTSGGDAERTERQRTVLTMLFDKITSAGAGKLPGMVNKLLPLVETSLTSKDIINLGMSSLTVGNKHIEQQRFPLDSYSEGKKIDGVFQLTFDEEVTKDQMYKYIFEDIKPTEGQ
ncbi:LCP family protein [Clostridium sp.]|uniref:LCP family protein n=1 Tax=Clostridium sp. TaxID=1506 RepID=UPI002FC92FBD